MELSESMINLSNSLRVFYNNHRSCLPDILFDLVRFIVDNDRETGQERVSDDGMISSKQHGFLKHI